MMSTATRRTKTRGRLWAISVSALGTLGVLAGITAANAADFAPAGASKPIVIIGSSIPAEARSAEVTVIDRSSTETRAKKCLEVPPGGNSDDEDVNVGLEVLAKPDGNEFVSYAAFQSSGCNLGEDNKFLITQGNQGEDENPGDPDTFGLSLD